MKLKIGTSRDKYYEDGTPYDADDYSSPLTIFLLDNSTKKIFQKKFVENEVLYGESLLKKSSVPDRKSTRLNSSHQ